jgi:hypothetical protein
VQKDDLCGEFSELAATAFDFLRSDYGYELVEKNSARLECWVFFRRGSVGVIVNWELGSEVWVELARLADGPESKVLESSSLEMLLDARRVGGQAEQPRKGRHTPQELSNEELKNQLLTKASELREVGVDVLSGDFSIFPRLHELEEANRIRREKELFGDPQTRPPDFFLRSNEGFGLESPRACRVNRAVEVGNGQDGLLVTIDPPILGQQYGLGDSSIREVVLAPRNPDETFADESWPLDVHVARLRSPIGSVLPKLRLDDLEEIGSAQIYGSEEAARAASREAPFA